MQVQTNIESTPTPRRKVTYGYKESLFGKIFVVFLFILSIAGMIYVNYQAKGRFELFLGIYGKIVVTYLLGKMILSFRYKPVEGEPPNAKVSVIIPCYNENPKAAKKTVESILEQDYPIHEIFFIDDGSKDKSAYREVLKLKKEVGAINLKVYRTEKNQGKRHAQAFAFERATGDMFVTIDSDGYIYPNAIRELLKPFHDPEVMAVTGHINARNRDDNWFTKLLDMRYDNAFRVERAAQSVTGNVLVCSGPISCYRREVIVENLERYKNQYFLGEQVQFGDDRCLTNFAIERGKTLYQSTAKCLTDVPSTLKQFIKQQIRWNKSFFRESLLAFKIGLKKPKTLVWVILEMTLWITFGIALFFGVILKAKTFGTIMILYYLAYICLSAYARNVFYVLKKPHVYLLAPLYGLIHLALLFPLRLWALVTIRENAWGTR